MEEKVDSNAIRLSVQTVVENILRSVGMVTMSGANPDPCAHYKGGKP